MTQVSVQLHPSSFEPTYEEWKRVLNRTKFVQGEVLSLPMRNGNIGGGEKNGYCCGGFEPTYEEWKLGVGVGVISVRIGFEPTYEEWKQV